MKKRAKREGNRLKKNKISKTTNCYENSSVQPGPETKYDFSNVIEEVKIDYPKLTFRLSVLGFIGSLAFYLGVIKDLHDSPKDTTQYIEYLESKNEQLNNEVDSLTIILGQ